MPEQSPKIIAIIQARMTSKRYPGKMLAPFMGKPVLKHVGERLKAVNTEYTLSVILATSDDVADDPLALYGRQLGLAVVRGARDDVLARFVRVLHEYPCDAFFRVCGDSPLLDPALFRQAMAVYKKGEFDLVTNVFPRTFPVGMSVELVHTKTFLEMEKRAVAEQDREHLTGFFYQQPDRFRIHNIVCRNQADPSLQLAVDELTDLARLEAWVRSDSPWKCQEFNQ